MGTRAQVASLSMMMKGVSLLIFWKFDGDNKRFVESYKTEYIHVNLSPHVKHRKLGRANSKRYDYDTKLLEYCYRVEQDQEDTTIFLVLFRPDKDHDRYEKLQVYPSGALNVGRLEGHRNLEDPALSSNLDNSSSEDSASALISNQLKQQHSSSTEGQSPSSDASTSQQNTSSDPTSSFVQLQATSTVIDEAPHHSQTQIPQRDDSRFRKCQKVMDPGFFDDSSTSRASEMETSTPPTGRNQNIANREPLSSIDLNIKSSHGTRIQIQTSMLPRPKRVKFAAGEKKLRSWQFSFVGWRIMTSFFSRMGPLWTECQDNNNSQKRSVLCHVPRLNISILTCRFSRAWIPRPFRDQAVY